MDLKKVCALLTGDAFLPFYGVDNNFFKIGDDFFEAVEDEDDGYRSCMDAVVICAGGEYRHNFFKTPVANVKAVEGDEETIKLIDESGHVWLEFGTDHSDSYYPSFVFRYSAKAPAAHLAPPAPKTAKVWKDCKGTHLFREDADAKIYALSAPCVYNNTYTNYVAVSAVPWVGSPGRSKPETYIFPTDAMGQVLDWGELPGSFQGGMDHARALKGLGYEIK
jgi:hypothetical protein